MELEFATNKALIGELRTRHTFAGISISADDEPRQTDQTHNDFCVYNAVCNEDTVSILKKIVLEMEQVQ